MSRLGLAFAAGLLAPVNPCGVAMLPAFLGFYLGRADAPERDWRARLCSGFTVGGSVSLGFVAVYAGVGLLVSAGLRWVMRAAAFLDGQWRTFLLVALALGSGAALLALRTATMRSRRGEFCEADAGHLAVGVNRMWTARVPAVIGVNRNWRAARYSR